MELINTKGYNGIQSEKSPYRNSDRRNPRSGRNPRNAKFDESVKDDTSGLDHTDEFEYKVGDIFVLGSIQEFMHSTSKHTSKQV